jgi:3-deoxy-D-manno-octulosonic-acid transferase
LQVKDSAELEAAFRELLANPERAAELGRNAVCVVRENSGAIERTVDMIVARLGGGEICVAPKRNQPLTKAS